jgi:hypothetical protein
VRTEPSYCYWAIITPPVCVCSLPRAMYGSARCNSCRARYTPARYRTPNPKARAFESCTVQTFQILSSRRRHPLKYAGRPQKWPTRRPITIYHSKRPLSYATNARWKRRIKLDLHQSSIGDRSIIILDPRLFNWQASFFFPFCQSRRRRMLGPSPASYCCRR